MKPLQLTLKPDQYILCPIRYNSSTAISIERPAVEEVAMKVGMRHCVRAYLNTNYMGSPVLRKRNEPPKGVRVFIPIRDKKFTVVQVTKVNENSCFGRLIDLDEALLLSYLEQCRNRYHQSLQFDNKSHRIIPKDLTMPSFEEWLRDKTGYVPMPERNARNHLRQEIDDLKEAAEVLQNKLNRAEETVLLSSRNSVKYDQLIEKVRLAYGIVEKIYKKGDESGELFNELERIMKDLPEEESK